MKSPLKERADVDNHEEKEEGLVGGRESAVGLILREEFRAEIGYLIKETAPL